MPVSRSVGAAASVALLFLVVAGGCASGPGVGSPAPTFEAVDDSGAELTPGQCAGKVVLLYFWATWCAPCVVSGPAVQGLHERYQDNPDVVVVGVHYNDKGDVAGYKEKNGYTFVIIPDGGEVVSRFNIKKIPSFVVVGKDGRVIHNQTGFTAGDEVEFEALIDAHLDDVESKSRGIR